MRAHPVNARAAAANTNCILVLIVPSAHGKPAESVSQVAAQASLHACVFFESFEGGVHLLEVRFGLRLITSVPRFVQILGELRDALDGALHHFFVVGIHLAWECLGKVADRKGVLVNLRQFLRLHRVGKLLLMFGDFLQDPIPSLGDLDFGLAFLVFLVVFAFLGRKLALSAEYTDGSAKPHRQ